MNAKGVSRQRGRISVVAVTTIAGGILALTSTILAGWLWVAYRPREAAFRADEPRVELLLQVRTDQIVLSESEGSLDPAQAVASVKDTIRKRLRQLGVTKWNVTRRPDDPADHLLVQVAASAGADPARVEDLVVSQGALAFHLVEGGPWPSMEALAKSVGSSLPPDTTVLKDGTARCYLVRRAPVITGLDIADAKPGLSSSNQPALSLSITNQGAERLMHATAANVGRQLAIVFDNLVRSTPRIENTIGDQAQITGGFTQADVADLALLLRSGSFAAPVLVIERRTIGANGRR